MTKTRKSPTILKPEIDEEAALRFASAGSVSGASSRSPKKPSPKERRISISLKRELYEKIARQAALKSRTVEEHVRRHLVKHFDK